MILIKKVGRLAIIIIIIASFSSHCQQSLISTFNMSISAGGILCLVIADPFTKSWMPLYGGTSTFACDQNMNEDNSSSP